MTRLAAAALLGLATACAGGDRAGPPCDPILPPPWLADAGLPDDTVWGFADLHAHPAIEVAFNGALV
ncbi:MAG: hypothetical protein JNK82_06440, partial [Myxococcaceae bacterium]|nr:hypothetical protein [Myxococcaceae bacterium]